MRTPDRRAGQFQEMIFMKPEFSTEDMTGCTLKAIRLSDLKTKVEVLISQITISEVARQTARVPPCEKTITGETDLLH